MKYRNIIEILQKYHSNIMMTRLSRLYYCNIM